MKIKSIIEGVIFLKIYEKGDSVKINAMKYHKNGTSEFYEEIFVLKDGTIAKSNKESIDEFMENLPIIYYEEKSIDFNRYNIVVKNECLNIMELAAILEPYQKSFYLNDILRKICKVNLAKTTDILKMMIALNCLLCRLWISEQTSAVNKGLYEEINKSDISWNWTKYLAVPPLFSGEEYEYVLYPGAKEERVTEKVNLKELEKYEELLKNEKLWSAKGFKYVYRKEQENISRKIRENFEKGERIFIEAPTGSGKSFAYILIAAICSFENMKKKNKEGSNFIISTDTKELQNQLIEKDIPNLLRALKLHDKVKYGAMKGKKNYICIDRLKKCQQIDKKLTYIFLNRLVEDGKYGDVENINYWAYTYFNIENYLEEINCDSDLCNFLKCKKPCYLRTRYNELANDNITVINHSLLASWPYEEKREITNLIIDEAHNLMEKSYDFFTEEFNSNEMLKLLKSIDEVKPSLIFMLKKLNASYGYKEEIDISEIKNKVSQIEFESYNILNGMRRIKFENGEYNFSDEINNSEYIYRGFLNSLREPLEKLKNSIYGLYRIIDKLFEDIVGNNKDKSSEYNFIANYLSKIKSSYDIIDNFLSHDKKYARIINIDKNLTSFTLKNTPVDIGELLNDKVLGNTRSVTFLSATLRVNNSYKTIKDILKQVQAAEYTIMPVFDLKRRTKIFIPKDVGDYRSKEYVDNSVDLILKIAKETNGHMLVLFNNNNRRELFRKKLEYKGNSLGLEIHQSKKAIPLLKEKERKIILLGSKSFFEGIDLPGDSLSCVVFDKIPNINPKDPLFKALKAYKNFNYKDYNYSKVSIKMKQGYGRLIRSIYDYGYFLILDGGSNRETVRTLENDLLGPVIKYAYKDEILSAVGKDMALWQKENLKMLLKDIKKEEIVTSFNEISTNNSLFWQVEEKNIDKNILSFKNIKRKIEVTFY